MSCKCLIVSAIVTPDRLSHCNVFERNVILNLLVFSVGRTISFVYLLGQFCVVRNSSSRNLWKNILQIWQQSRYSCKVRIGFSLFFPFIKTVIRYINKRTDSTISTKATLETRSLVVITANLVLNLKRHKQLSEKLGNI